MPPSFATLIDALPDPILVVIAGKASDLTSRRFILANAAARELLRIDSDEGVLVSVVRDPEVLEAVDTALFGGRDAQCVYETGGAQPRTLRAQARPLPAAGDGVRQAILSFHDETELRRAEGTRVDFLANASHELRTPLASLTGFIETLQGHAREDTAARDRFLGIMHSQARRMARLIDDLTSLSRIELNEHIAPRSAVDLGLVANEVVEAAGPLAAQRAIRLETALPAGEAIMIRGDRDQIVQVVQNLLDNAIKYSPDGEVVRVTVDSPLNLEAVLGEPDATPRMSLLAPDRPGGAYAALKVSDKGPGIPREHLPRLSERFYRVEAGKRGDRPGTGLGLAIVKHIVNRHRGGLVVASAEGCGTSFTAYFPLVPEPASVAKVS